MYDEVLCTGMTQPSKGVVLFGKVPALPHVSTISENQCGPLHGGFLSHRGTSPSSIGIFPYKPTISGYTPFLETPTCLLLPEILSGVSSDLWCGIFQSCEVVQHIASSSSFYIE